LEYHEDLVHALSTPHGPKISAANANLAGSPGSTLRFELNVDANQSSDVPVEFILFGNHAEWGQTPSGMVVRGSSSKTTTLDVTIPPTAAPRDQADLYLIAHPRDDPLIRSVVRLTVDVDANLPVATVAPTTQSTPGTSPGLFVVALIGSVLIARWLTKRLGGI
jgi:hypothetical protein